MNAKNGFHIIGRIGNEPELKEVGDNTVLNVSIAYNNSYKDKQGEKQEKTHWFQVSFWNERAVGLSKVLKKGQLVSVAGTLAVRVKEQDEKKTSSVELIPSDIEILTPKKKDEENAE